MIGLALAASLSLMPVQNNSAWTAQLEPMGWNFLGLRNDGRAVFYVRQPVRSARPNGFPQLWGRVEMENPESGTRSQRNLMEYDCINGRWRSLDFSAFSQNNLAGPVTASDNGVGTWQAVAPGTSAAVYFGLACAAK